MKDITIEMIRKDYIVVKASTDRFGPQEIMYEGIAFRECFDYIKRETGADALRLIGTMSSLTTDRNGETFPVFMRVEPEER